MDTERVTETIDRATGRWGPEVLRWTAALLWLGNVSWKRPPAFGRTAGGCGALCGYTQDGIDHPVLPGAPWFFEHVVSPRLWAFGWVTILIEGGLAILLMAGRYRRTAAVIGIAQSFAILAAVANTPGEWYWSYLLMMALHVAVFSTAAKAAAPSGRAMAGATVGFGLVMAAAHAGEGFTGTTFTLFDAGNGLPGDLGKNLFGGSVALGLIVAAIGVLALLLIDRLDPTKRRVVGVLLAAIGVGLFLTYDADGLIIGLGSTTTTACVITALGLAHAVRGRETQTVRASTEKSFA